MADTLEEIKKYKVEYYAGGPSSYMFRATVDLCRDDGSIFACLYFHRDPATMTLDDQAKPTRPYAWCHFPDKDFADVLDLLRNEKPLYFRFITGVLNMGVITTLNSAEPIGEGEPARTIITRP